MSKTILINSLILSAGILLGRLSGYIRELIIAYKFEVSVQADNIILMLTIPDILNNLLAAGAISGILIPLLSKDKYIAETLAEFTKKLFIITFIFYILLVSIIFVLYDIYIFGILTISLLSIFPNIFTFISSSYLQYEKRFKAQSLNTLVFNVIVILFLLLSFQGYLFAMGVVIASILRMLWITYDLRFTNITIKSLFVKSSKVSIRYKLLIFMIFANGLIFINPMIDKIFASFLDEGSVSILSYAEKIYLLPVSVFLTTYAVAMFPDLSKMVTNNETHEINNLLKKSISFNIFISFIVALFLYIFSYEIVSIFYSIANIKDENLQLIANILDGYVTI
jgi:putative peptidoglycan lipid II flippase